MDTTRLRQINDDKLQKATAEEQHRDLLSGFVQVSNSVVDTTTTLIKYLEGSTSKVQVVNQLKEIGTPDAFKVVDAIQSLHTTLKTHKNVDLTEITSVMKDVLKQVESIPKTHAEAQEQKFIDYTDQLKSLETVVASIEKAIKEQKLVAEAPIVNVPETQVNVEAPDLKPLQKSIKDVITAVTKIVIPEYKTDNKAVEKLIKDSNKLLKGILEKPVSSGGGGGGRATPYQTGENAPAFVTLETDGSLPVTIKGSITDYSLVQFDDTSSASYEYYAYMNSGSSWYIKRLTTATSLFEFTVPVATSYSTGWTNRASLTYIEKGGAF